MDGIYSYRLHFSKSPPRSFYKRFSKIDGVLVDLIFQQNTYCYIFDKSIKNKKDII